MGPRDLTAGRVPNRLAAAAADAARWLVALGGCAPIMAGCADSNSGDTGSFASSSSSSSTDSVEHGGGDGASESSSSAGESSGLPGTASTGPTSDTGPPTHDVAELVGAWEAIDPIDPAYPDTLLVREDGTATADTHWIMDGTLWAVRLEVELTAAGNGFDAAYVCAMGNCTEQEFEAHCELLGGLFACAPAPSWYHAPELDYRRVP